MGAPQGRMLEDYVAVLKRRRLGIIVAVLVALLLGGAFMVVAEKTYAASAKVLVQRNLNEVNPDRSRTTDGVNLDTEAQVVTSAGVSELAAEKLDTDLQPTALVRRVTVTVPPNTTVLQIRFLASTPEQARDGAQAYAEAYLDYRADRARDTLEAQTQRVEDEYDSVSKELAVVNRQLAQDPRPARTGALRAQRQVLVARFTALSTELTTLKSMGVKSGLVINEAQVPRTPQSPNPFLVLPSALLLGLLIGLAYAFWREERDPHLHDAADLERVFGLTPVAHLQAVSMGGSRHFDARPLYHMLRAHAPHDSEVALVTAPDSPELADEVSQALVRTGARSGARAAQLLGAHGLPAGVMSNGALDPESVQRVVDNRRAENDFVVVALPSDAEADLPLVARHVDVVLILVDLGRTTRDALRSTLQSAAAAPDATVLTATVATHGRAGEEAASADHDAKGDRPSPPSRTKETSGRGR